MPHMPLRFFRANLRCFVLDNILSAPNWRCASTVWHAWSNICLEQSEFAAGYNGFSLLKVICFIGSSSGILIMCPKNATARRLIVVEKVSSCWLCPCFGLLFIVSFLACSRTRWFVAVLSRWEGKKPKMRLSPLKKIKIENSFFELEAFFWNSSI